MNDHLCSYCKHFNYYFTKGGYVILCDRLREQEGYQIYLGFENDLKINYPSCEHFTEDE